MTDRFSYCRGALLGMMIGFSGGLIFWAIVFQGKLPPNESYVEKMQERLR